MLAHERDVLGFGRQAARQCADQQVEGAGDGEAEVHGGAKVRPLLFGHQVVHLGEGGVPAEAVEHQPEREADAPREEGRVARDGAFRRRGVEGGARRPVGERQRGVDERREDAGCTASWDLQSRRQVQTRL